MECPPGLWLCLGKYGFRRWLRNLVGNAQRHADSRVLVRLICEEDALFLVIDDDGPGVPESMREAVFEPFYRTQDSRARVTGGVGLGLALVKAVVEREGGGIHTEPSSMGGASFVVRWPADRVVAE